MKRLRRRLLLGSLGLMVAGAACSGVDDPSAGTRLAPVDAVAPGGELRIGITEPGDLDPTSATTSAARLIVSTM